MHVYILGSTDHPHPTVPGLISASAARSGSDTWSVEAELDEGERPELDRALAALGFERLFECVYLPITSSGPQRRDLVQELFFRISPAYEQSISLDRNIGCYEYLLAGGCARLADKPKAILDFGCGPGTIASSSARSSGVRVLACDFVEMNRATASARGLEVISPEELSALPGGSVGLSVSTYVMHYRSLSDADFERVGLAIEVGGMWAANFHKGIGCQWFAERLLASRVVSWSLEWVPSSFGPVVFARRSGVT
jgi:hypothetical protein